DLALLESGAIPVWDGISNPLKLSAISASKFDESGINHIYFSVIEAAAVFVSWFQWKKDRSKIWLILGGIHLLGLHWLLARTGLLAFYFSCGLLFLYEWSRKPNNKTLSWALFIAILLPLVSYFSFAAVRNKVKNSIEDLQAIQGERSINHRSLAMRVEAWKTAVDILQKHPMGVGLGDVDSEMQRQYEENETLLWKENRIPPHNQYLESGVASGILSSLLLLTLLIGGIVYFWKKALPLEMTCYATILLSLSFESLLQTQLGICLFPFILLMIQSDSKGESLNSST
ncbi:MAG: O-antigen ligase family protein, partial [Bacteroidota bacterium]|nr:O-antigen ligase family protein [Bacteroidota bacterium]MDX5431094.1 O-antigen ligase family protein [Bacteroidota bacterium]MDX5469846.1 O-antigen ligase family protein [Bacteroidota bacterium]